MIYLDLHVLSLASDEVAVHFPMRLGFERVPVVGEWIEFSEEDDMPEDLQGLLLEVKAVTWGALTPGSSTKPVLQCVPT